MPVISGLEALEHDADAVLRAAPIQRNLFDDPDGRVPHRTMMKLWQEALERTGDDNLGIHIAEASPIASFGLHAYTVLSSPTLRQAYRRGCRYQRLIHEATNLVFEEGPTEGRLRHALPGGGSVPRHPAEFLVTAWLRLGRLVAGEDWTPNLVSFSHPAPDDLAEHTRVFGPSIRFESGMTALSVAAPILDAANQRADEGLLQILDEHARGLLRRVPNDPTLSDTVRARLEAALENGAPTAERIAANLNLSVRSLHRGLKAEATTFREILDQLRHERAAAMLPDSRFSIPEIAYLLGFAEISSFYRAFKRWTGTTPADFRNAANHTG